MTCKEATKTSIADVLVLPMDENAMEKAYEVAGKLRLNGVACQLYVEDKKFKNKINYADKLKIPFVVIIGQDELDNGYVTLKDMFEFNQQQVSADKLVETICAKLKK